MLYDMGMDISMIYAMPTFAVGAFLGAILIRNFNGERGRRMKWLFYSFYPLHLAVLGGVALALSLVGLGVFGFSQ